MYVGQQTWQRILYSTIDHRPLAWLKPIADRPHTEYIDRVEVGRRVAGHIRVAFEVADSEAVTESLSA
jgi:hypothetical protein